MSREAWHWHIILRSFRQWLIRCFLLTWFYCNAKGPMCACTSWSFVIMFVIRKYVSTKILTLCTITCFYSIFTNFFQEFVKNSNLENLDPGNISAIRYVSYQNIAIHATVACPYLDLRILTFS